MAPLHANANWRAVSPSDSGSPFGRLDAAEDIEALSWLEFCGPSGCMRHVHTSEKIGVLQRAVRQV